MAQNKSVKALQALTVAISALLSACATSHDAAILVTGYDNELLENGEGIRYRSFDATVLDVPEDLYIGEVRQIKATDDMYVLLGEAGVYVFNTDGTFRCTVGTRGHGHGEYISPGAVAVCDDQTIIEVLDSYQGTLLRYRKDGTFLSQKRIDTDCFTINRYEYADSAGVFGCRYVFGRHTCMFFTCDTTWSRSKCLMETEMQSDAMIPLGAHPYNVGKDRTLVCVPFDNTVYQYNPNGGLTPVFCIDTRRALLPKESLGDVEYRLPLCTSGVPVREKLFYGFTDVFETSRHVVLNTAYDSYMIIDKKTGNGVRYSNYSPETKPYGYLPVLDIREVRGDMLIGLQSSQQMRRWVEFEPSCADDEHVRKMQDIIQNAPDRDVPVVLLYELQ